MQLQKCTHDGPPTAPIAPPANEDDVACGLARQSSLPAAAEAAHAADAPRVCEEGVHSFTRVLTTGPLAPSIVLPPPPSLPPPPRNCVEALCGMLSEVEGGSPVAAAGAGLTRACRVPRRLMTRVLPPPGFRQSVPGRGICERSAHSARFIVAADLIRACRALRRLMTRVSPSPERGLVADMQIMLVWRRQIHSMQGPSDSHVCVQNPARIPLKPRPGKGGRSLRCTTTSDCQGAFSVHAR